jgi:hypothetical protein
MLQIKQALIVSTDIRSAVAPDGEREHGDRHDDHGECRRKVPARMSMRDLAATTFFVMGGFGRCDDDLLFGD